MIKQNLVCPLDAMLGSRGRGRKPNQQVGMTTLIISV